MHAISWDVIFYTVALALVFDFTNGFHDAANVVSTVIATRVLKPFVAILLASLLNLLGATQISAVSQTITTGLVIPGCTTQSVILCAIVGAIGWNLLTWYFGIPSSSSYALIGGLVGATWGSVGLEAILWNGLLQKVIIPMVVSPIAGFFLGLLVMKGIHFYAKSAKKLRLFSRLQVLSACMVALAHGFNDAQKSMSIIALGLFTSGLIDFPYIPLWVIISCALVMGLGTASGGFRIIRTVGYEITDLQPAQGFAAETSASFVILFASLLGMPVSSTHMIVGSVTGVGAAKGKRYVKWNTGRKLIWAWILTLPGSALVACAVLYLISK